MARPGQGFKSWISVIEELTWGTSPAGARDGFARILSEGLTVDEGTKQKPGMGERGVHGLWRGNKPVGGDIPIEANFEGAAWFFLKHAAGKYTFTADTPVAGANKHEFELDAAGPPDKTGVIEGLTIEDAKGDIPTTKVFLYDGIVPNSWTLNFATDEIATILASLIGREETPDTARIGAPVYPSAPEIKYHYAGAFTVAGIGSIPVKSGTGPMILNNLDRRFLMSRLTSRPIAVNRRVVSGTLVAEFQSLAEYNAVRAATEGALAMSFVSTEFITGATPYDLTIAATTSRFIGPSTPTVPGEGPLEIPLAYQCIGGTDECKWTLTNGETTYGAELP